MKYLCTLLSFVLGVIVFPPTQAQEASVETDRTFSYPTPYNHEALQEYNRVKKTSHYITMRDSVRIAADVYLPKGLDDGETVPTILYQTRYWRSIGLIWPFDKLFHMIPSTANFNPKEFVLNGYALVTVDVRGTGASSGFKRMSLPDEKEVRDGAEIVDWIVEQPWSNDTVGAAGISYIGNTAEYLLINQHPNVQAIVPMYSIFDIYDDAAMPGGVFFREFIKEWNGFCKKLDQNKLPEAKQNLITNLFVKGVSKVRSAPDQWYRNAMVCHNGNSYMDSVGNTPVCMDDPTTKDGTIKTADIWSPHMFIDSINNSGAAIYSYTGWWDAAFTHAAVRQYLNFTNPDNKLIIGPWNHGGGNNVSPFHPEPSEFNHMGEVIKFFDHHLKGQDNGLTEEAPVHYYTLGKGKWQAAETWPPKEQQAVDLYLRQDQQLTNQKSKANKAFDPYEVDTSTGTGKYNRWNFTTSLKLPDQYPDRPEWRKKTISYTSAPLSAPKQITGHPVLTLYMRSSAKDGALFAYLQDVAPDGKVHDVTEGQLRLAHRKTVDKAPHYKDVVPYHTYSNDDLAFMPQDSVVKVTLDLYPISWQFQKGHSIRLTLAGADSDNFKVIGGEARWEIHRSRNYSSRLKLPVIPNKPAKDVSVAVEGKKNDEEKQEKKERIQE